MDIFKRITKEGAREIISELLRSWLWPTIMTVVPTALLYMQGLPLGFIAVGGLAAFAFSVWGVFGFSRWRYYRNPEWKLRSEGGICSFNEQAPSGSPTVQICMGLVVSSTAEFPIEFLVTEMQASIGSHFNPDQQSHKFHEIEVPAMGVGYQYGFFIDVPVSELKDGTTGKMSFKLKYGHKGALKHELKKAHQCAIYRDNNGQFKFMFTDLKDN